MVFFEPSDPICSSSLPRSNVSCLISIAGRLYNSHPCVTLKASTALNCTTTESGIPRTCPLSFSSDVDSALISCNPCTSNALVLLSTIRLRRAFRSPMAGRLLRSIFWNLSFFFVNVRFTPRSFLTAATTPGFFFAGRTSRGALEEKEATGKGRRIHGCCIGRWVRRAVSEALERHRQQVWTLIIIWYKITGAQVWGTTLLYSSLQSH